MSPSWSFFFSFHTGILTLIWLFSTLRPPLPSDFFDLDKLSTEAFIATQFHEYPPSSAHLHHPDGSRGSSHYFTKSKRKEVSSDEDVCVRYRSLKSGVPVADFFALTFQVWLAGAEAVFNKSVIADATVRNILVDSYPLKQDTVCELWAFKARHETESHLWRGGSSGTESRGLPKT